MIQELIILTVLFWVFFYIILKLRDKIVKRKLLKKPVASSKPIDPSLLQGTRQIEETPKLELSAEDIMSKLED